MVCLVLMHAVLGTADGQPVLVGAANAVGGASLLAQGVLNGDNLKRPSGW